MVGFVGRGLGRGGAREASSAGVDARRTILFDLRALREGDCANGGLRMPSFGVIRNFWLVVGIDSSLKMRVERSAMVELGGKLKV